MTNDIENPPQSIEQVSLIISKPIKTTPQESIVVFGATGLVGSRIVKALSRSAKPHQTIFVISRDRYMHERPQVISKYSEPGNWSEVLKTLSNVSTIYCALGPTRRTRFLDYTPYKEFYNVNHNLYFQIASTAKELGVSTFVMISGYDAGYIIRKIFNRKTIVRAATERGITMLGFEHLIIMRPGPLAGIREKRGSLKMFSMWSVIEGCLYIAETPLMFINPATPFLTFSFGTSVGKAAVVTASKKDELPPVTIAGHFSIVKGAFDFNSQIFDIASQKINEMAKVTIKETATAEEVGATLDSFAKDVSYLVQLILGEKFSVDGKALVAVM